MLAKCVDGEFVVIFQTLLDVVGIECCKRPYFFDVVSSEGKDIGVGTDNNEEVAEIAAYPVVRSGILFAQLGFFDRKALFRLDDMRLGQEGYQFLAHADRS